MRLIKMLGLAAIAAVAATAFIGASSAMALITELEEVVICKENVSPCPAGKDFPSGSALDGELVTGTKAVLLSSTPILCEESATSGVTRSLLAHGEITALTFSKCHTEEIVPVKCTVETENVPYLVQGVLNAGHTGYEAIVKGIALNTKPQAKVVCGEIIECKYGEASVLLTAEPNVNDTVLSVLQALTGVGPLCGAIAHPVWHAKYLTRCLEGTTRVGCWLAME